MAANADPMQGSLFGDSIDADSTKDISPTSNKDLSDQDLTADAQKRPRRQQNAKCSIKVSESLHETEGLEEPIKDILPWSHHSLVDPDLLTPVLRHYVELKNSNPERLLLYRLGDFFECFFEDAIKISRILELTLTSKEGGKALGRVPMAGIPHHAAERYCAELIRRGLSVALCDQLETTPSKGALIKRAITRILTPGTVIAEGMLEARRNNWLAAVVVDETKEQHPFSWGLAIADVSTGEFLVSQGESSELLQQELTKLEAAELIGGESDPASLQSWCPNHLKLNEIANTPFSYPQAELTLKSYYKLSTLNGIGLNESPLALRAAGGLLAYLKETKPSKNEVNEVINSKPIPLDLPKIIFSGDSLIIDSQTRRNLELTATQRDSTFQGSLLWAVDRTLTSMGGRCLRRWIEAPLINPLAIIARQSVVSHLVHKKTLRQSIRRLLRAMGDLERLAGRAGAGQAGARDLVAIADGLERLPLLSVKLKQIPNSTPKWFSNLINIDSNLPELAAKIRNDLISHPPLSLSEGGLINDGVDPILDGLRNHLDDQDAWLSDQEKIERKLSGNTNLRLQYHRTFGYFLAVSKAKANNVPKHWIRRQTLANEERFITPNLKEREGKIFQAKARAAQREYELFCDLREVVGLQAEAIRKAARSVAGIDSLAGLAEVAATNSYCSPEILKDNPDDQSRLIHIEGCRHPVVEQMLVEEPFKPNDIHLGDNTDLIILTGPNASGKSCYLRQIGLVQLLTQIGSWIPATKAALSISDRIFTRVGAVDDLVAGQSTFMVEMAETAYILNQATKNSLILLDEIGRGTATFDGLSIAWAVSEFLAKELKSRSIFATHYHELNTLSESLGNVANFQVLVEETGEDLIFLHQVVPGGASRSYGIEAARLAGVPQEVVKRAREVLHDLEHSQGGICRKDGHPKTDIEIISSAA